MGIVRLEPACKDYLWGGTKLKAKYGKHSGMEILAETWELSCHPDGQCTVASGEHRGKTLQEYLEATGAAGENCKGFEMFPVLVKLIDAKKDLSIQVHPGDGYALAHEGQYGKTEMWVVVDCEEGASLIHGFTRSITEEECRGLIAGNRLTEVLRSIPVKKGDTFFIREGEIHAIGAGITIAEIQQNSNLTYRVYDYGRRDAGGNLRQLHVDKALDVLKLSPPPANEDFGGYLGICSYFAVEMLSCEDIVRREAGNGSFHHLLVVEGEGEVRCGTTTLSASLGDSFWIDAGTGPYVLLGNCTALLTTVPETL